MKKILHHLAADWYKYLLELIVITAGVLGAFALNNWNEGRKEDLGQKDFILSLRSELQLDTMALTRRMVNHEQINADLLKVKALISKDGPITENDMDMISWIIPRIEVLTTVHKNFEKNNWMIAGGVLEDVSPTLNNNYQKYLEQTQSNNAIINKLGETLQRVVLQDVNPLVDLDYGEVNSANFNLNELRNSRVFKNAINRSIWYRKIHIGYSEEQIEQANSLLLVIDELTKGLNL